MINKHLSYHAENDVQSGRNMSKNRSSISKAQSYKEIGEYWDKHDIACAGSFPDV